MLACSVQVFIRNDELIALAGLDHEVAFTFFRHFARNAIIKEPMPQTVHDDLAQAFQHVPELPILIVIFSLHLLSPDS